MQPDATAFPPGGFDPNDPQLNLLAQRMKSHLRKPMVLTDLTTPRNVSEYSRATYVPVLDKGVPDESFGLLDRRTYAGAADSWAADVGSLAERLTPRVPEWLQTDPKGPMDTLPMGPRSAVLGNRKATIDEKRDPSLPPVFRDRMGRSIDRGRDEYEQQRAVQAAQAAQVAQAARVARLRAPVEGGPPRARLVRRGDQRRSSPQEGTGLIRDAGNALNRVVDAVGERADLPPGKAREWAYYALLQMINAAQQQSISYDEYYSLKGEELLSVLQGSGIDWKRVEDIAGGIGNAAAVAGVGTAATGIGAAATPFLEGAAGVAKGVEFAASMLGSGTELDDALRGLYGAAQTIAKREKMNPSQVAEAVRNLRGAPMVRANRGLVSNTDLADSNYVAALESTLQSQRKLSRRRSGAPETLAAQPRTSRRGVKYYHGVKHAR